MSLAALAYARRSWRVFGSGAGAYALRDRAGNLIRDRAGNTINTRATT